MVIVAAALLNLIGCAADPGRTGGWAVGLRIDNPAKSQRAQYELLRDGRLLFAGGVDAGVGGEFQGSQSSPNAARWAAPLTDAEISELIGFVSSSPKPETVTPTAGQANYKGRIESPSGSHAFVSGATPFIVELERRLRALRAARIAPD